MTIEANFQPLFNVCNGVTTSFGVTWPFRDPSDLDVQLVLAADGSLVSPAPALNGGNPNDYTVTGTPDPDTGIYPSGSVVFNVAPPSTYLAFRGRATQEAQDKSLPTNGRFPAKAVEGALDKLMMLAQELEARSLGSIRIRDAEQQQDMSLSLLSSFKGRLLGFDLSSGLPMPSTKTDAEIAAAIDLVNSQAPVIATGTAVLQFDTVGAMTSFTVPTVIANMLVYVRGRDVVGDGGQGFFRVTASVPASVDQGIAFQSGATPTYYFVRQYTGPALSIWYGAKTSNTAASNDTPVANLIASGVNHIHFVGAGGTLQVSTLKTIGRSNLLITFDPGLTVKQTGSNADSTLFYATGQSNIFIRGGILTPGSITAATTQGWSVHWQGCTNCGTDTLEVTAHRRGAVLINGCTRTVDRNIYIHDSIVNPATDDHTQSGYGVLIANSSTDCHSTGGRSYKGSGIEFAFQSIDSNGGLGHTCTDCSIDFISIVKAPMYAAMGYRLNLNDTWKNCSIKGRIIDTVYGNIPHQTEGYVYGAGVYQQGVEGLTIDVDHIENTCVNTLLETLAPASVGVANCRVTKIRVGQIVNSNWYGVALFDSNAQGDTTAGVGADVWVGEIRNSTKIAVYCKDFPIATIGGHVIGGASSGFKSDNIATSSGKRYDLRAFSVDGCAGDCLQPYVGDVYISGGYAKASATSTYCLSKETSGRLFIENYHLDGAACVNWPLDIQGSPGRCEIGRGVRLTANASGANAGKVGRLAVPVKNLHTATLENANASGGSAAWPGTYKLVNTLANTATPNVQDMCLVFTGGTTPWTGLAGMEEGQELEVISQHTITLQHSSTFYMAGAANLNLVAGNTLRLRMTDGVIRQISALAA